MQVFLTLTWYKNKNLSHGLKKKDNNIFWKCILFYILTTTTRA